MRQLRRIAVALLVLLAVGAVQAQEWTSPSGVVVDQTGGGVHGARLTVRTPQGAPLQDAATAADGSFAFAQLPAGSYWLDVSARSFRDHRLRLEMDGRAANPLRIVLDVAPYQSEVTVTAERGAVADVERAAPVVTVRTADDFRRRPLPTIGNALEGAAGVMVQQSTYGQVSPFLRGLTGYQVLNLVDGVRVNNSTFRSGPNQYLAFVDPSQSGRIEVLLGPASAQFGSDAMGGAVQVLTPELDFATDQWTTTGSVNLAAGSADRSRGADAAVFLRGRRITGMMGATRRRAGALRGGEGRDTHHVLTRLFGLDASQVDDMLGARQPDTGFSQSGLHAKVMARLGSSEHVTLWYQRSDQGGVRANKDLWGGLGRLRSDFGPQRLQLLYGRYERLEVGWLDWLSATISLNAQDDGSTRQNLRNSDRIVTDDVRVGAAGYAGQAGARLGSRHALVFGGEVYDERIDARRDELEPLSRTTVQKRALYPNGSRYATVGVFLQDQIDVIRRDDGRRLVARVGGRFTRVGVRTEAAANRSDAGDSLGVVDSDQSYQDWTFSTSLTYAPSRAVSLHGLVGRGFRAPNLNDLGALGLNDLGYEVPASSTIGAAFIGVSDGEGVLSSGRPVTALTPEQLMNYELGVAFDWTRLYLRVQGFDAELQSPIVRRTLLFAASAVPSTVAGVAVTPLAQTVAQGDQGVASVATAFDPRAVKAFVNDGSARYYGMEAIVRHRLSARWTLDANYTYLAGHDLNPRRPVRRLPPQQAAVTMRYQPGGVLSWIEASVLGSGAQDRWSGGDLTDERIGAARRRSDIADFFRGGRISPYIQPGLDAVRGTADDVFEPTGETLAEIRDRVLPIGATINGVRVIDDATRVPLYTRTPGFVAVNLGAGLTLTRHLTAALAFMNALDRSYRVHGSGVDAPGRGLFATLSASF